MQDNFNFGISYTTVVKKENVSGIILDIDALKTDGTVAELVDLNKSSIDLSFKPANGLPAKKIFSGYLGDLLSAMYNQNSRYDVYTKAYINGYKIRLGFDRYPITIEGGAELEIKINFSTESFTGLSKNASSINIETLQTEKRNSLGAIPLIETHAIAGGKENMDEDLGSAILGILVMTDHRATFEESKNPKIRKVDLISDEITKSISANALFIENLEMLSNNPDTPMRNQWVYNSNTLLNNVKLKADFTQGVAVGTKIIVNKLQSIR
ncbi:hypothetical protein [Tenacibaculum ovolyticum]|uniref:hypothetical protein n=1 Tax=Tenacibaculum ovolyticum TaxID=104270 RepID=UPI001F274B5F|nr:hypothetical protein [Tenacibaculum ovolyticum]